MWLWRHHLAWDPALDNLAHGDIDSNVADMCGSAWTHTSWDGIVVIGPLWSVSMEEILVSVDNSEHLRRQEKGDTGKRNRNDTMCFACREQGKGKLTGLDKLPCHACIKIFHTCEYFETTELMSVVLLIPHLWVFRNDRANVNGVVDSTLVSISKRQS